MQDLQQRRARRTKRTTAFGDDAEAEVYVEQPQAQEQAKQPLFNVGGPRVWLELDGAVSGQLVFELDSARCVNAAANFMFVAVPDPKAFQSRLAFLGAGHSLPDPLPGSHFSCVMKNEVAEFGTSNTTSYWGGFFKDEGIAQQVNGTTKYSNGNLGALSMSNAGSNTNASRFFITMDPSGKRTKELDAYHVCFGQLVEGFDVLERLNAVAVDLKRGHTPKAPVFIANSGIVNPFAVSRAAEQQQGPQTTAIGSRRGRDTDDVLSGRFDQNRLVKVGDDADDAVDRRMESTMVLAKSAKRRRGEVLSHDPRFAGTLEPVAIEAGVRVEYAKPTPQQAVESMQRVFEYDLLEVKEAQKHKRGVQQLRSEKQSRVSDKFVARSRNGATPKPQQKMRYK